MIGAGDLVVAVRDGGHDKYGFPRERPLAGRVYRVTSVYSMSYGLGCTLEGMDPFPYRGYFLYVENAPRTRRGWYFKRMEPADAEFTQMMRDLVKRKQDHDAD